MSTNNAQWEVQEFIDGQWRNAIVAVTDGQAVPRQFVTQAEATAEYDLLIAMVTKHRDTNSNFETTIYRVGPRPPIYEIGHRFSAYVPSLKKNAELILSYSYHNLSVWRYHLGLVLGREGDPVPERYKHCHVSTLAGEMFVDFTTVDEAEIDLLKEGKL